MQQHIGQSALPSKGDAQRIVRPNAIRAASCPWPAPPQPPLHQPVYHIDEYAAASRLAVNTNPIQRVSFASIEQLSQSSDVMKQCLPATSSQQISLFPLSMAGFIAPANGMMPANSPFSLESRQSLATFPSAIQEHPKQSATTSTWTPWLTPLSSFTTSPPSGPDDLSFTMSSTNTVNSPLLTASKTMTPDSNCRLKSRSINIGKTFRVLPYNTSTSSTISRPTPRPSLITPLVCPFCTERPLTRSAYRLHLSSAHQKHSCLLTKHCLEAFDNFRQLREHCKLAHGDTMAAQ